MSTSEPWNPSAGLPPLGVPVPLIRDLTFTRMQANRGLLRQPAATIHAVWTPNGFHPELRLKEHTLLLSFEDGAWQPHHLFVQPTPPLVICRERVAQAITALTTTRVVPEQPGLTFGFWEMRLRTPHGHGLLSYGAPTGATLQLSVFPATGTPPTTQQHRTLRGVLRQLQDLGG